MGAYRPPVAARAALAVLGALTAGALVLPLRTEAAPVLQTADQAAHVYGRDCAWCHGPDGEGSPRGPSLVGVGAASADFMLRTGRMPLDDPDERMRRQEPQYPAVQIEALVEFVASFGDGPPIPDVEPGGDLNVGGRLYRIECAACHGASGGGGALTQVAVPSVLEAAPVEVAEAMIIGPGAMPVFGRSLTEGERNAVVAYVGYLQDPQPRGGVALKGSDRVGEGLVAWTVLLGLVVPTAIWLGRRR